MKKITHLLFIAFALVAFSACSKGPGKSLTDYVEQLSKGEQTEKLLDGIYVSKSKSESDAKDVKTLLVELSKSNFIKEAEKHQGLKNIEVVSEEIDAADTSAVVQYKIHYEDGTSVDETQQMIKEDGKWKLNSGK